MIEAVAPRPDSTTGHLAQAPSDEDFDAFFRSTYPELTKYGAAWGRNWQDAEDAASEVMIAMRRHWHRLAPEWRGAYARRALVRAILKIRRARRADTTSPLPPDELPMPPEDDTNFISYENAQWVEQLLGRLPAGQRAVMRAFLEGTSFTEFAADLQRAASAPGCAEISAEDRAADLTRRAATARKQFQLAKANLKPLVAELQRPRVPDSQTRKGNQ